MSDKLQHSLKNGAHALLNHCVGKYEGTIRTWFEEGDPVDTATVKGELRQVLDGMFILHEYESTFQGKPMKGLAMIGHFLGEGRWQTAWVDSFHNGTRIMFSEGAAGADPLRPDVSGSYPAPPGPNWGWRTKMEQPSPELLVITHFNITPDGQEAKAVEFSYRRV